jgi:hypothetical protein
MEPEPGELFLHRSLQTEPHERVLERVHPRDRELRRGHHAVTSPPLRQHVTRHVSTELQVSRRRERDVKRKRTCNVKQNTMSI